MKKTNYSTREILELKAAIRSGEAFTSIAERFSVAYNRSYAGLYMKICNLAKRTRKGKNHSKYTNNVFSLKAKKIEISNEGMLTLHF